MDLVMLAALPNFRPPGPRGGLELFGSPHAFILMTMALLLVIGWFGSRPKDSNRECWLLWAYGCAALSQAIVLVTRLLESTTPSLRHWNAPRVFELWSEHAIPVLLVAGCVHYVSGNVGSARKYAFVCLGIVTFAAALLFFATAESGISIPEPGLRPRRPPMPLRSEPWVLPLVIAGLGSTAAGWALASRNAFGTCRIILLSAITVILARDAVGMIGPLLQRRGPSGFVPLISIMYCGGLLLFGYIFIRERSVRVRADYAALEEQARKRAVELESTLEALSQTNALLLEQSTVDSLTGVGNRRSFDEALDREWGRARRSGEPITVALVDIDEFKRINDFHGHPVGDYCLKRVAGALQKAARRPSDIVARYGGDEFAVLLPAVESDAAAFLLEEVRQEISRLRADPDMADLNFSVSIGIACCRTSDGQTPEEIVRRADQALYAAKQQGRDRVAVAVDELLLQERHSPSSIAES